MKEKHGTHSIEFVECSGEYVNTKLRALSSICLNAYICAFSKGTLDKPLNRAYRPLKKAEYAGEDWKHNGVQYIHGPKCFRFAQF